MRQIWIIAKRELDSFFDSLIAYILLVLFLGLTGLFTWIVGNDIFYMGRASLASFFNIAFLSLYFFIPTLTMRLVAEEKKTGTIELLLTKAVTDRQVVLGKFLATFLLVLIALGFTLPYVITVANIGDLDAGEVIGGYAGLGLMSAMYIGIGLYASSITNNQIVAILLSLLIGSFFHFIFGVLANQSPGLIGELFYTLSVRSHFDSISRGVLDSSDLVYFVSITFLGLFLTEFSLTKRTVA